VAAPARRIATGQFEQRLCDVALHLDLVRSGRLRPVVQGGFQTFHDASLPQAFNGARAGAQGRDDLGVRIRLAASLIRQKQNARMG
jgi:hypothetical protein